MEEYPTTPDSLAPTAAPPARASVLAPLKAVVKGIGWFIGIAVAAVPALLSRVEARLGKRQEIFLFWGQVFSFIPGLPGKYFRKCYYFLTLDSCTLDWEIGFLSYFTDRRVEIARRVYVGAGTVIATAVLGEGCLIGSRVSILSGKHQHHFGPDGRLTSFDAADAQQVQVGSETWIGEGAILMADVGSQCIVAAGSVVSSPVPDHCMVGGNPARFVAKTNTGFSQDKSHE